MLTRLSFSPAPGGASDVDDATVTVTNVAPSIPTLTSNGPKPEKTAITINGVASGSLVRDLYILDESTVTLPYLGSPGPTVLEIPVGISGQLTHLFIIFFMGGLAIKAPTWQNKIRVKVA